MSNINDLDNLITASVRDFERLRFQRGQLAPAEREKMLTEMLGPKHEPRKGEAFVVGDAFAGITAKSVWFESRRVHYATIVDVALGEVCHGERVKYCVDL